MTEENQTSDNITRGADGRPMLDFPSMTREPELYQQTESGEYVPFAEKKDQPQDNIEPGDEYDSKPKLYFGSENDPYKHLMEPGSDQTPAMKVVLDEIAEEHRQTYPNSDFNYDLRATQRVLAEVARESDMNFLANSGLGNHPQMIRAVIKLMKELEPEYTEAMNLDGYMRDSQLNALRIKAADLISQTIQSVKNSLIKHYGPMRKY
jgi:hypothetical protein